MGEIGAPSLGPGRTALGLGHLSLHEPEEARRELEAAWTAGYRPPEVAHALGRALGMLYQRALEEARRLSSVELRRAQIAAAQRDIRAPALAYLREAPGRVGESPSYDEGLVALFEERFEDALAKARQAVVEVPWRYEAHLLQGDAHFASGKAREELGDSDGALAAYERAGEAYRLARDVGRSDPAVYVAEARRQLAAAESMSRRGKDPAEAIESCLAASADALRANPEDRAAPGMAARTHFRRALYASLHGGDAAPDLAEAVRIAEEALAAGPDTSDLLFDVGSARSVRADQALARGEEVGPDVLRAIEELPRAARLNPGSLTALNGLGNAYTLLLADEASARRRPAGCTGRGRGVLPEAETRRAQARRPRRQPRKLRGKTGALRAGLGPGSRGRDSRGRGARGGRDGRGSEALVRVQQLRPSSPPRGGGRGEERGGPSSGPSPRDRKAGSRAHARPEARVRLQQQGARRDRSRHGGTRKRGRPEAAPRQGPRRHREGDRDQPGPLRGAPRSSKRRSETPRTLTSSSRASSSNSLWPNASLARRTRTCRRRARRWPRCWAGRRACRARSGSRRNSRRSEPAAPTAPFPWPERVVSRCPGPPSSFRPRASSRS